VFRTLLAGERDTPRGVGIQCHVAVACSEVSRLRTVLTGRSRHPHLRSTCHVAACKYSKQYVKHIELKSATFSKQILYALCSWKYRYAYCCLFKDFGQLGSLTWNYDYE
jgi:hypothetical protein